MSPQPGKDTPVVRARRQAQADRIMAAAIGLFARQGFHRTSMQQIAAEVGMSVGSLYQYLENKEAIIVEATRAKDRENAEQLDALADPDQFAELLRKTLSNIVDGPPENSALQCEIVAEASRNPAIAEGLTSQFDTARSMLADAFRGFDPDLALAEARLRAELFIVLQAGYHSLRSAGMFQSDPTDLTDRALATVLPHVSGSTASTEEG